MKGYYSIKQLIDMGFKSIGKDVLISKKTSIINPHNICIGNNVRIDDFTFINASKYINIGNYVHIAHSVKLFGGGGIEIGSFVGLATDTKVFSATDDFSGDHLFGPTIPVEYTNVSKDKVIISDYCVLGTNSVVLPGIKMEKGSATGAFTLVNKNTDERGFYIGIPAKWVKQRSDNMYQLGQKLLKQD